MDLIKSDSLQNRYYMCFWILNDFVAHTRTDREMERVREGETCENVCIQCLELNFIYMLHSNSNSNSFIKYVCIHLHFLIWLCPSNVAHVNVMTSSFRAATATATATVTTMSLQPANKYCYSCMINIVQIRER